jgi:MOSC domain-containing protein YiiM
MAKIIAVCLSKAKGQRKHDVRAGRLIANFGLEGDAHAAAGQHRQVSLLALESIDKMRLRGLKVGPGDFAENITTEGLKLHTLPAGTRLRLGLEAVGEISQIGKECHKRCEIHRSMGVCIMPTQGVFARVLRGGEIRMGDAMELGE